MPAEALRPPEGAATQAKKLLPVGRVPLENPDASRFAPALNLNDFN